MFISSNGIWSNGLEEGQLAIMDELKPLHTAPLCCLSLIRQPLQERQVLWPQRAGIINPEQELLCVRHCTTLIRWPISFPPHNNPIKPISKIGNQEWDKLEVLSKVTQLVKERSLDLNPSSLIPQPMGFTTELRCLHKRESHGAMPSSSTLISRSYQNQVQR